ncbi:MAG: porin, partial [Nitrosospira sp.]
MSVNVSPLYAFTIETKGSPKIKSDDGKVEMADAYSSDIFGKPKIRSDDGNFEMVLGGRAHLDVNSFNDDKTDPAYPAFGSQIPGDGSRNGFDFRRGWLDVSGKYYDLTYIVQNNFTNGLTPNGLLRVWASIGLGPGRLTVGQFKAHRSMEELTSSNDITMMERPSNSSSGIFAGR